MPIKHNLHTACYFDRWTLKHYEEFRRMTINVAWDSLVVCCFVFLTLWLLLTLLRCCWRHPTRRSTACQVSVYIHHYTKNKPNGCQHKSMTAILENENWVARNKIIKYCVLLSRIMKYEVKWNVLSQHRPFPVLPNGKWHFRNFIRGWQVY